jgi:hypothetical protein
MASGERAPPDATPGLAVGLLQVDDMAEGVPELTPAQLLDQPWIKRIGRVAWMVAALGFSASATYFFTLGARVTAIEQDRKERAVLTDQATNDLKNKVTSMQIDINVLDAKLEKVSDDTTLMKGILQEMQRSKSAELFTSQVPWELRQ